ncbi:MAG: hypothetical protein ACE5QV_08315 [Fidelibacterota bacterium]
MRHSWVDSDVQNGQTYYYAVVSYDSGFTTISADGKLEGISPAESPSVIKTDLTGRVTFADINTAVVTPGPPVAGYIESGLDGDIMHKGPGTGYIDVQILDPSKLREGIQTYEVIFMDSTKHHTDKVPEYYIKHVESNTVVIDTSLAVVKGGESGIFDGLVVNIYNDSSVTYNSYYSGWVKGESDYVVKVRISPKFDFGRFTINLPFPADIEISFHDSMVSVSEPKMGTSAISTNFKIFNVTDSTYMDFMVLDNNRDKKFDFATDDIVVIIPDDESIFKFWTSWVVNFRPILEIDTLIAAQGDTTYDTTWVTIDPPSPGDVFEIVTAKPFRTGDVFRFSIKSPDYSTEKAKRDLDDIIVVPNPYVVTASWEPPNRYRFGRGERKIGFFNLPKKCTIRIYTVRGYLVDTIEHDSSMDRGFEFWDLISKDGMDIAYGMYIYNIDAPGIGKKTGKFAVIK